MRRLLHILLFGLLLSFAFAIGSTRVSADTPVVYVVTWGDTLGSIAARFGTTVRAIVQANNLRNPDFVWTGERLTIPGATTSPAPSTTATYVVQSGDTLFSIATRHGTSVAALMQANGLYNYWIYVGQTLRIPGQAPVPPPAPQGAYYVVQAGDFLSNIAARFGTTVYAIQIANKLPNASFIWTGQRLFIPGAVAQTVTAPPRINPPVVVVYPTVIPYIPPTATPYTAPPPVAPPPPPPTSNSGIWEAVLLSNTPGGNYCSLLVTVVGKTDWPVVVATTDGSWISDPKYTGSKPEISPYAVEFAHSCTGTWRVIPLGLNTFADVEMIGGRAELEFHQH